MAHALIARPLYRTTVLLKVTMATTGVVLFGFLLGHMLGNLQAFMSPQKINDYAKFLHETPSLLWGTRLVLLASIALHIASAIALTRLNQAARPTAYAAPRRWRTATYASRTMMLSGPIIAAYLIYHLLHFTVGSLHPNFNAADPYNNLVYGFQQPVVVVAYLVAMGLLALHLHHGVWSFFQSLGISHPRWDAARRTFATAFTVVVILGFTAVPLAVLLGVLKPFTAG